MKKNSFFSSSIWISVLLISVILVAFIIPVLPVSMHKITFNIGYTIIYFAALFSLKKRGKRIIALFVIVTLLEWITAILNLELINDISKGFNVLFFLVIVIALIHQIASAKEVLVEVILGSIAGYLLLGIIFSMFIMVIARNVPEAYSIQLNSTDVPSKIVDASPPLYYSYVTLSSLGYGDIVPLKPISRSLSTLMTVIGQLYIAIIVAMLVGKFAAQQSSKQ